MKDIVTTFLELYLHIYKNIYKTDSTNAEYSIERVPIYI